MFKRFQTNEPDPKTELQYVNNFTLVIAVLLSAQATDKGVNKATAGLFAVADTPEKMLALGLDGVYAHIKTIGLYNTKGKNIIALSQILIDKYQGIVPNTREALEELPGVGRKTANVVLNIAFGQPTMAVDTHIFRVSNRTGLAPGKTPRAVEDQLLKRVPEVFLEHAHHWLILHGRYVCKAQNPACSTCLIGDLCDYNNSILN
ncbi:MAG: endonuclease III [Candidatus Paracaedibacteraceae bacterium]|nr:endonuclease III [Candidatus Paracaedibacteraceae bacterium]